MILITGASGFLGSTIANMAHARGLPVRALVRPTSDRSRLKLAPDAIIAGDMTNANLLAKAVEGVDAVVHCAATTSVSAPDPQLSHRVNVEGTKLLVQACERAGARRYIQISSQSALAHNPSVYGRTKYLADEVVRASALDWTILKPGLIYGPGKAGVFSKVVEFTQKFPVIPVLGSGKHEQCPVHVEDVAWAALQCIETPLTIHREYDLGGGETMTFDGMIQAILAAQHQSKALVHLPLPLCMLLARTLGLVMKNPPVTTDNVLGVRLAGHVDNTPAERDFHYRPRPFRNSVGESL